MGNRGEIYKRRYGHDTSGCDTGYMLPGTLITTTHRQLSESL